MKSDIAIVIYKYNLHCHLSSCLWQWPLVHHLVLFGSPPDAVLSHVCKNQGEIRRN